MYQWYARAEKCYAYLVDLESTVSWRENLAYCRWFTRGWTLQELIAPVDVYFFDQHWNMLFRKSEGIGVLTNITGIDRGVLACSRSLQSISVAQRMSWASRRVTARVEDEAYCLLGIFDVNMPMLYGEGRKAFLRLQEEIVRICPDLSIFAWKASSPQVKDHNGPVVCSVFASAALDFAESGSFAAVNAHSTNDFFISNQGIKLHMRLTMTSIPKQQGWQYIFPVCKTDDGTMLGIRLRKCGASQLVREDPWALVEHDLSFLSMNSRTMYLLARLPPALSPEYFLRDVVLHTRSRILQIALSPKLFVSNTWPWSRWDGTDQVFFVSDNLDLDYAATKVSGVFNVRVRKKIVNAQVDFMLYSLGWANTSSRKPVYTIVPWKPSDSILKDFNDKLEQYDYVTSMVEGDLRAYKIRMSSSAECELADSGYSVTVNCSSHIVNDETKCLVQYWKLDLSCDVKKNPN